MSLFYDVGAIDQLAINLFYGWGYNFYRIENQLRADDLVIREKACWLLGQAHTMVATAESEYRRKHLPPPSRARPLPDPNAVAGAQTLESLSTSIGQLEATIRALPIPENDRMTERYRQEAQTLAALSTCDQKLVGLSAFFVETLDGKDSEWMLANYPDLLEGIALMQHRVRERTSLLK